MRQVMTRARSFFRRTFDLWLAVGLAVAGVYFFSGYFTTVRFDRERIEVRVERGWIQVTGLYHYTNQSRLPAVLTLGVPFPIDSKHPPPRSFSLCISDEDGRILGDIAPIVRGSDVRFRLVFRPGEAKWVRHDYSQEARTTSGRYLLVTTRAWRRPIERADYVLRLPPNFRLVASNYLVSPITTVGPGKTFSFSKSNFYPERDWEFAWDEPHASVQPSAKESSHEKAEPGRMSTGLVSAGRGGASLR